MASGRATGIPKTRDGVVEAIRTLRAARTSAIKARTQAINQIRSLLVTTPETLRAQLRHPSAAALVSAAVRLRPGPDLAGPCEAAKSALRLLARRYKSLHQEIIQLDAELKDLTARAAPELLAIHCVGPDTASQLLITAGDNPSRLRREAAFARLCGVAPIPASSGQTSRHRLSRAGDHQANRALHQVIIVRLRHDERTRAYVKRRTTEGMSKKEIIRCLKRHLAREIYKIITRQDQPQQPGQGLATAA